MSEELDLQIADYLQRLATKNHPITGKQIAREFDLPSDQDVRHAIHRLRVEHGLVQICSGHYGYFWSGDPEDWAECANHLEGRWSQIYQVWLVYQKALKRDVKQTELQLLKE